jgi:hypothetical protein
VVYRLLADLVVVLHVAFVLFAILGALAVVRRPRLAGLHVPAVAWAGLVELAGWTCPLTPLEIRWRELAGGSGYESGFVERYLIPVLYPVRLTREMQIALGVGVFCINAAAYGWALSAGRRAEARRQRI